MVRLALPDAHRVRRARGQALVLLVALVVVLSAVLLLTFDTGQAIAHKQRLLNAADAAAYGGATWQARMLNFQAYANRAIVANEVAIAQAVSVRSWSDYLLRTLENVDSVARYVPYLGEATAALRTGWGSADSALQPSLRTIEAVASSVNVALATAQSIAHAAGAVGAEEVARRTLAAHDAAIEASPAAAALFAANAFEWSRFTATYGGAARSRLRETVLEGRDGFTALRSRRLPTGPAALLVRLEKRGGTELVGFDSWRSLDTLALHTRRGFLFGRFRERVPIGWGAAENARMSPPARGVHGGTWGANPGTSRLAEMRITGSATQRARAYVGLQATRDVVSPSRRDDRTVQFTVDVARAADAMPLSSRVLGVAMLAVPGQAGVDVAPRPARERYFALSAAEVRFERPLSRADARREYPSLFNPYWTPHLAPATPRTRALVAAARGVPDPFVGAP